MDIQGEQDGVPASVEIMSQRSTETVNNTITDWMCTMKYIPNVLKKITAGAQGEQ